MQKVLHKIENSCYKTWRDHPTIAVLAVFVFITTAMMLFYTPLCPGGDFYVHYNRLTVLIEAIQNGNFPTYMDYKSIEGYGYIIKLFYSDFLLIPFALIGIITSATTAYLTLIFTVTLLCALFTYIALKRITKNKYSSLIISILYTFCTYRIFDIYIRGALGEVLSFSCLPLILLGAYEIVKGDYKKWYILTIGMSLLIYSHLISTMFTSILLSIFLLVNIKKIYTNRYRFFSLCLSAIICIPLTAYYIFPMLEQMLSNSFYYQTNKLVDGVIGFRLNEMVAGLFNSVSLRNETLFPKLGALLTFIILTRIFITQKTRSLKFGDVCVLSGLVLFLMALPQFPWSVPPFAWINVVQFPWRLLEYISFFFAIGGGIYLSMLLKDKYQQILGIAILIILYCLIFNSDSIHYRTFVCQNGKPDIAFNTNFRGMIGGEYLPSKIPSNNFEYEMPEVYNDYLFFRGPKIDKQHEDTQITNFIKDKGTITFTTELNQVDRLELPLTYYIGYKASLNGNNLDYIQSDNGLIEVELKESGNFIIEYTGTILQKVSFYITLVSIVLFAIYIVYDRKKKTKISAIR